MLTHGLWQRRYGSDPSIVGKAIMVNDRARTVIGVLPPRFKFPLIDQLYMPFRWDELAARQPQRQRGRDAEAGRHASRRRQAEIAGDCASARSRRIR